MSDTDNVDNLVEYLKTKNIHPYRIDVSLGGIDYTIPAFIDIKENRHFSIEEILSDEDMPTEARNDIIYNIELFLTRQN
nr:hypothetical protein 72 [bacterium]